MVSLAHPKQFCSVTLALALCATQVCAQAVRADHARAEQAYLSGARLVNQKDLAGAEAAFARAATLDPTHSEYNRALLATRDQHIAELVSEAAKARILSRPAQAEALLAEAKAIDPTNTQVLQHAENTAPLPVIPAFNPRDPAFAGPIQIAPTPGMQDLHLRSDAREAVTQAARAYGVKTVFDDAVTGPPVRFDLEQTTYAQAMPLLLRMTHLFAVPLDEHTLLIAKDTQDNRARLERQLQETVYIPGSTTEQLNEYTNIIKNVFDVQKIVTSPGAGTIVIRAPEMTLKAVNYTLADLVDGGADVSLRVQLFSVDKSRTRNTGAQTPSSVGAFSVAAEAQNIVSQNQSAVQALISAGGYVPTGNYIRDTVAEALLLVLSGAVTDARLSGFLGTVGGGLTLLGINYGGNAAFNLALNASEARALDDITVRIGDKQTTTLRIGSKYPITTSTYSSGISSATASLLAGKTINGISVSSLLSQANSVATVPMVQFEDLGITLKTDAYVLKAGLVTVKVDMKLEALTGASANNIPVLTSRAFTSTITLADGGTAVMLSDMSSTEAASLNGLPGLSELPGFQGSVADKLKETDSSELVMLITPSIVRRRSPELASRRITFVTSVPQDY